MFFYAGLRADGLPLRWFIRQKRTNRTSTR